MFKKISKNLIIFSSLFLTFFCFQNVFAYTEIYSEDFDSYTSNSCISYQNGTFGNWKTDQSNVCLSSTEFSSSPNSLIGLNGYNNFIYYDDFSLIEGSEISAVFSYDAFLVTNGHYGFGLYDGNNLFAGFDFINYYNDPMYLINGDYNGTPWVSGDYDLSEYLISKENSWITISYLVNIYYDYDVDLEGYFYKFTNSIYIDDFLVLTYNSFNYNYHTTSKIELSGLTSGDPTYIDNFIISDAIPPSTPSAINGVCGDANGSTFDWADYNDQDFCSSGDFYLSGDNSERMIYACVGLNGGTTQYNCFADYYYDLDPTITDVIDFDFDNFSYDFDEGDVSKNWLIDVFKFLFLPREQTLQKFFTTFENFKEKIPFGYIYLIQDKFKQVSLESTEEFALNLELLGEDYEVFSVSSLKQDIGENTFNVFYNTMKALIWFIFVLYLVTKSQKLFNNND